MIGRILAGLLRLMAIPPHRVVQRPPFLCDWVATGRHDPDCEDA